MISTAGIAFVILVLAAATFLYAGWRDLASFTIPNRAVVALAALYPIHVLVVPGPVAWELALGMATLVFAVGCGLFALRAMGGGDVKLLTVAALWAGAPHLFELLLVTTGTGLLLAVVFAVRAAAASIRGSGSGMIGVASSLRFVPVAKLTIPYGVAIAAGGLFVCARLAAA